MAAHELVTQRLVVEHLAPPFRWSVEDDTLTEYRRHERIRLGLVEHLFRSAEVGLVRFWPGEKNHIASCEAELADIPAFGADPLHEADGVDT